MVWCGQHFLNKKNTVNGHIWEREIRFALVVSTIVCAIPHPVLPSCPLSAVSGVDRVLYGLCPHRSRSISGASSGLSTSPLSSPRVSNSTPSTPASLCPPISTHLLNHLHGNHTTLHLVLEAHCMYYTAVISDSIDFHKNKFGIYICQMILTSKVLTI